MLRVLLAATLCLAPASLATPVVGPAAIGVVEQGTTNAHDPLGACLAVLTPMTLVVSLLAGTPTDVLRVVANSPGDDDRTALATLGAPAVIHYVSYDSCPHFSVEGLLVSEVAVYAGAAERTLIEP